MISKSMDFLNAIKSGKKTTFAEYKKQNISTQKKEISIDEDYINNTKDSEIIYRTEELIDKCEEFVLDTLLYDKPLLITHHLGYKNFITEMLHIFQNNIDVIIQEKDEQESDSEDDLDISDLYYYDTDKL